MKNTMDGFTGDVVRFIARSAEARKDCRAFIGDVGSDRRAHALKVGLCGAVVPFMENSPSLLKEFVARALLSHVDWDAVADWVMTDPEAN